MNTVNAVNNERCENMLKRLTPDIEMKCQQIRENKHEKFMARLFAILCAMVLIVPCVLIVVGISIWTILIPVAVLSVVFLIVYAVIFSFGGNENEQIQ